MIRPMMTYGSRVWAVIGFLHWGQCADQYDAGVEHAQEIVDFGDRADGRTTGCQQCRTISLNEIEIDG